MERKATVWEKMFVQHISDKISVSRIYKELLQLNEKKKILMKNMSKRLKQMLHQRQYTHGKEAHMKKLDIISH